MEKIKIGLLVLNSLILLSGCSYSIMKYSILGTSYHKIDLKNLDGKPIKAKSLGFLGLGAEINNAVNKALRLAGPGYDLLINGSIDENDFILVSGYTVKGTAIKSQQLILVMGEVEFERWLCGQSLSMRTN